jgi:hypothetical protein
MLLNSISDLGRREWLSIFAIENGVHALLQANFTAFGPGTLPLWKQIPVVQETKFLGLIFDSKLNFKAHIKYLRDRGTKALNLLKVLAHTDWGADCATLLKLYQSHVRSKLDYGCVSVWFRMRVLSSTVGQNTECRTACMSWGFRTSIIPIYTWRPMKCLSLCAGKSSLCSIC